MLGPATETYGVNKVTFIAVALPALFCVYLVAVAWESRSGEPSTALVVVTLVVVGGFGWLLYWLATVKVSLHPEGLSYHSWRGTQEMRWDEVEHFFYRAAKRSVNFIPIGTYYHFILKDRLGNKISFGNRIQSPRDVGQRLIEQTYQPLLAKMIDRLNNGEELDFGPIKVSRPNGLTVRKTFRNAQIPWDQLAEYRMDSGQFYLFKVGQKWGLGKRIGKIPNAFVLLGLLDTLYGRSA
ncbi:MAG: DUF6585 family protein [Terriglobia bacterium]